MLKLRSGKLPDILLLTGFVFCLLYVWLPVYFITGDGPSHVYNAQIIHDLWLNKNVTFYSKFYNLVYEPNPNWLSTLAIAALMFIVNGVIAEKIFLTIYVVLYVSGFYLLLKKISGNVSFIMLVILFFVFPQTLAKGFYNFSFSIAFYFWMVWSWLRFLDRKSTGNAVMFCLFSGLIFFTHLLAFGFGAFTCAALVLSYSLALRSEGNNQKRQNFFLQYASLLALFLLPFFALMLWFTDKEGGMHMQLRPHFYRLIEMVECKYFVNVTHIEDTLAKIGGMILVMLFCFSLLRSKKKVVVHKYDGFLLSLLFVAFVYLCFPESFLGHLILISMRAQVFVWVLVVCCVAYRLPTDKMRFSDGVLVLMVLLVFGAAQVYGLLKARGEVIDHTYSLKAQIFIDVTIVTTAMLIVLFASFFKLPFEKVKNGSSVILFACFLGLTIVRLDCLLTASTAVGDYISAEKFIKPYSVVLPLDFAPCGKDAHGRIISDRNFLFYHASQYMGLAKPLIILDNYEANMGYFPLRWLNATNPYFHLSKNEGIEAQPPSADIGGYKDKSGVTIDYVLMWCFDSSYLRNEHFSGLYGEIKQNYHLIYTSPGTRTLLFVHNQSLATSVQ